MVVMKFMFRLFLACVWLSACSTPEPLLPRVDAPPSALPSLSLIELQNRLGLIISPEDVALREKSFDACDIDLALKEAGWTLRDCHRAHFALVQFQLRCRPSEDSSQILNPEDLTPLRFRKLKWQIGKLAGSVETDGSGMGVIRALSSDSVRKNYLRISTGVDFLNVRLDQLTSIVTPPSWCSESN